VRWVLRVGEVGSEGDEEPGEDEEGADHPGGFADAVEEGEGLAASGAVPCHVGEVLGGGGAEEEEADHAADVPGLGEGDVGHHCPAGHLEQHAARDGDREVGEHAADLRPPGLRRRTRERHFARTARGTHNPPPASLERERRLEFLKCSNL
jgi:hypothetical protein